MNVEIASENILKHFYGDGINKDNVISLLNDVTKKYSCPYTLFFFYRSVANQGTKEPIEITLEYLSKTMMWYCGRHYASIHPQDISQEFPTFSGTPDYEDYSVDNWKWKTPNIGRPGWVNRRRKRIIERGSSNQSQPIYASYQNIRSLSEYCKKDRKNANKIQKLFNTNEYWGVFALPYYSPSKNYDMYRATGNLLWSVSQNQWLKTFYKKKNLEDNQIRFQNIETFTNYDTERFYKSWRFPFGLDDFQTKRILTNISNQYSEKFWKKAYSVTGIHKQSGIPTPLSFYLQSFNFGIEKPSTTFPPFDLKDVMIEAKESFSNPTHLWRKL